jgi:hypothetical protein
MVNAHIAGFWLNDAALGQPHDGGLLGAENVAAFGRKVRQVVRRIVLVRA